VGQPLLGYDQCACTLLRQQFSLRVEYVSSTRDDWGDFPVRINADAYVERVETRSGSSMAVLLPSQSMPTKLKSTALS
jgi:hypothetical protein